MSGNVSQANQVLTDNPKLAKTPGLAVPVLKSPNPTVAAPIISHSYDVTTTQQALSDHAAEGDNMSVWQKVFNGAGKVVMGGLNWLAKPLQEVQRDYKFIHSVYTRHGIFEGVLATAGIAGGMALGSFIGPEGTIAGGELAATLERKLLGQSVWRDSYNDSENKNYKVSAGRDFSNAISHVPGLGDLRNTDKGLGKIISGATDAVFDFQADPFVLAMKARTAVQAGKFIVNGKALTNKIPFRASAPGVQDLLERNSLQTFNSPEQLDKLYQSGSKATVSDRLLGGAGIKYQRALRDIAKVANEDGPGGIVAKFPQLRGLAEYIAPGRGAAAEVTAKDVHDVFVQAMWDQEFMKAWSVGGQSMVPSRTVLRSVLSKASDKLRQTGVDDELYLRANQTNFFLPRYAKGAKFVDAIDPQTGGKIVDSNTGEVTQVLAQNADKNWNLPVIFRPFSGDAWKSAIAGKTRTFSGYLPYTIDSKTLELSNLKFDPHDPAAADTVYRIARFSMSDNMARQVTSDFLYGDIGQKRGIYAGMINEMVKAAGIPNDSEFASNLMNKIGMLMHGPVDKVTYGWGRNAGRKASMVETPEGSTMQAAFEDQRGYFSIPDFREVKSAMRSAGMYGKLYGRIDDFAAKYTDGIFKPLALLTGGFGLRIAASELLPSVFRFGAIETAKNKISSSAAKMNYKLASNEDKHILENAIHAVSEGTNPSKFLADAAAAVGGKGVKKVIAKGLNKLASEDDLDLAARIAIATQGHMAVGATLTGHGIPAEQQEFMRQVVDLMGSDGKKQYLKPSGEFSHYTSSDSSFDLHYYSQLAKSATTNSRRTLVADALDAFVNGSKSVTMEIPLEAKNIPLKDKTFYHGTSRPFAQGTPDSSIWGNADNNLFGDGLYTTDNPKVASSYAKNKGDGKQPTIYSIKWNEKNPPRSLNLDDTASPNLKSIFQNEIKNTKHVDYSFLEETLNKLNPTGKELFQALRNDLKEYGSSDNSAEIFQSITNQISANYDVIQHVGGLSKNQTQHNVSIWLNPDKLKTEVVKNTTTTGKLSYDEAWKIAEAKDLARIRGVEYNPTAPGGMGKPLAKGMDEYASERKILASYSNEDPTAFASRRSDIMSNLFIGGDGTIHRDLMEQVANGIKPSLEKLKSLEPVAKPAAVAGQRYDITVGPNLLNRITNFGFGRVVDPLVNNLSRQPLYFNHVKNEMRSLQGAIDKSYLSEEEATRIAMMRGAYSMVPQIHNTVLRTQFSVLARNFLPFYFAQEQAMRRAGALIASNPAAFREYQLVQQGMNDPGFVHTDANGAKNITLPVVGELGSGFLNAASMLGLPVIGGLPVTATGNLSSLKTVLPEIQMPGVSPFVSIALNTLGSFDPTLDRSIKKMTGGAGFSTSLFDQLIPNAPARNLFKALNANEKESSFHNAIISAIAAAKFHGQIPSPDASPMVKQQFLDRIKNNARSILIMKALLGTISPVAPAVSQEDPGLRDEFYKMSKQKSTVTGNNMTYPEALSKFLAKHGSSAISYTVARTEATVRGANMPYTNNAINWIENNQNLIYGPNAVGAAFLIPQVTNADGDAQAIHDEVIKMHLRANKTPDDFLKSVYVAAGNNSIAQDKVVHDKAMAVLDKAGLSKADERAAWSAYVQDFGKMNPIWWDDYSSTAKGHVAQVALNDLQTLFTSKNPPTGRQANLVKGLLNDWHIHNTAITGYRDSRFSEAVQVESDAWNSYLDDMSVSTPELNSVINSVFRRL